MGGRRIRPADFWTFLAKMQRFLRGAAEGTIPDPVVRRCANWHDVPKPHTAANGMKASRRLADDPKTERGLADLIQRLAGPELFRQRLPRRRGAALQQDAVEVDPLGQRF